MKRTYIEVRKVLLACLALLLALGLTLGGIVGLASQVKADFSVSTESKLLASDGAAGDQFGYSVSISGDTAIVGAYNKNSGTGAAYIFVSSGSAWVQQAKLTASDAAVGDYFGYSVSISGDTAVVGAFRKTVYGISQAGAAYVFTRSGSTWSQQELLEIKPGDSSIYQQPNDWFGYAVSISGDTLVVGTPAKNSDTGTAYVFTRSGSAWSLQTALNPLDVTSIFGYSVSLSGSTAVIGSPGTGAAYVFTGSGANWSQQAKLNSSDVPGGGDFGHSVSLSGDTVVVGADFNNSNTGAAYVFTRSGVTWSQQQKLTAADAASSDYCGSAVSISGDTAVIGASGKDTSRGACYIFVRSGSTWSQQTKLSATDGASYDYFGGSVSLDGDTAVIGASWKSSGTGAAYVYNNSSAPPPTTTALSITTTSPLPGGTVTAPYSQTLAATGGTAPYTWSITAGTLPAGLTLNPSTGAITGTPTTAGGPVSITFQVADSVGGNASKSLSISVGDPGLLRVQTSPAVPTTISLNGVQMDDWALNWVKLPAGSYNLSFTDVYDYTTPTSVTVNYYPGTTGNIQPLSSPIVISPDVVTEVIANFTQDGSLRVQTSPPMAATVYCNGQPMDDWAAWTNIAPGQYTISFEAMNGYITPPPQVAHVTAGATTNIVGTYVTGANTVTPVSHGLLRVQTSPAVPTTIYLNGIQMDDWALNWVQLPPGSYMLSFSDVYDYATPTSVTVNYYPGTTGNVQSLSSPIVITANTVTEVIVNFTQLGNLRVETTPATAATIFCNGQPMDDWAFWTNIEPGQYTISFQSIASLLTPPPITVTVSAGAGIHVVGNYTTGISSIVS